MISMQKAGPTPANQTIHATKADHENPGISKSVLGKQNESISHVSVLHLWTLLPALQEVALWIDHSVRVYLLSFPVPREHSQHLVKFSGFSISNIRCKSDGLYASTNWRSISDSVHLGRGSMSNSSLLTPEPGQSEVLLGWIFKFDIPSIAPYARLRPP